MVPIFSFLMVHGGTFLKYQKMYPQKYHQIYLAVNGCYRTSTDIKKAQHLKWRGLSGLLRTSLYLCLVPMAGLEPARLASPPPQDGVSTNFTTSAFLFMESQRLLQ